ncbi:flagellar biosynthesis regulator FlaF [Roseibium aestuarii]|uniref:Flagellar biosynthesis regulator FlaF n=1 Tax=Roseibium aestuarii TaxID=2600299 RepID=A0ABW4JV68_9HYPH|nr:flagellar biosynthesis regulator FlaF [Roseibium aestuarii]
MYSHSYAETMDEICLDERTNEAEAVELVLAMLMRAEARGTQSREAVEALFNLRRLWAYFLESLGDNANELPKELRANLISIGIWVLQEAERVRQGEVTSFAALIEINTIIRDSLRGAEA